MTTQDSVRAILAELDRVLGRVDEAEIDAFCAALLEAQRVVAYALGRENLALRSFVMRLMHIGLDVAMVGDITAPPVGPGDVFLGVCGPGYLSTTAGLMGVAHQADAEGAGSGQAMGSAFEQGVWILLDALVPRLQAAPNQSVDDLRARHANLE